MPLPRVTTGGWGAARAGVVPVDVGHGNMVDVAAGSPFRETIERLAVDAHYGGYFRVFLGDSEIINPSDAPATIEAGQHIAITSYDKVG